MYDVIIIGGGHAGLEAALSAKKILAKKGSSAEVLLITGKIDTIGHMSCNPSIGGLAKGHLVREIDALGGEMGICADITGVQFRRLNESKGPAVRATRCQSDRNSYMKHMSAALNAAGIVIKEGLVEKILTENGEVRGIRTATGEEFTAKKVIITTGTFLNGLLHFGMKDVEGGRLGDFTSKGLSASLKELGFKLGRLKTGTCPRLKADSIDFSGMERQDGDTPQPNFSFRNVGHELPQLPCHITYTNSGTHDIIRSALDKSPLYSGKIKGTGPRYCPSIEDKVMRFAERTRHQVFIEPEGLDINEVYVNGLSTSLPIDVQLTMVRSIKGLERGEIAKSGYAVEYDFIFPTQLFPTLETKLIKGLYSAGQINGTSGYEEAAGQGLVAGINSALSILNEEPFILSRSEAYIGVLIDDLVTKGTEEPYRMFTSRAEHRLLLREDNADARLSQIGFDIGLLDDGQYARFQAKQDVIKKSSEIVRALRIRRKPVDIDNIFAEFTKGLDEPLIRDAKEALEIEFKYEGYIKMQYTHVAKLQELEKYRIPQNFDYDKMVSLSNEVKAKLKDIRPVNLAQAGQVPGVTPAAISVLMIYLRK